MPIIEEITTENMPTAANSTEPHGTTPSRMSERMPQHGQAPDISMMMSMMMRSHADSSGAGLGGSAAFESARRHIAESSSRQSAVPEWDCGIAELLNPIGTGQQAEEATRVLLGTSAARQDSAVLEEHGVVAVLSVGSDPQPCKAGAMKTHTVKLGDLSSAAMLAHLPRAFDFIDGALEEGNVLVASEDDDGTEAAAAAVVVGWLMARKGVPNREAPAMVQADRPSGILNKNFEKQLRVWSKWKEFPGLPDWVTDGF